MLQILREDLPSHNVSYMTQHLSMVARHLQSQSLFPHPGASNMPLKPSTGRPLDAPCKSIDDEWLGPQRQLQQLPSMAHRSFPDSGIEQRSDIDSLHEKSRVQDTKLSHMGQRVLVLEAKVQNLEKKVKEQSATIRQQHDLITDLETRCSKGLYQWKITEYARRRREAVIGKTTVLHSPGFYSSFRGYKMCLRVNLNGVETGYGTHLSLFVHLMRGEFDDALSWPFQGKITLTVVDQSDDGKHVVETLEGNESVAAFHRPSMSRNHKGFGYMEFMPLTRMEGKSFIKNDMLVIRCQVQEANRTP